MHEDMPGNVDTVEVTMISPVYTETGKTGKSFIAGIVLVDVPCEYEDPGMYWSYTQEFYGNEGGKTWAGETTRELLLHLLTDDLTLGSNGIYTLPATEMQIVSLISYPEGVHQKR